MRRVPIRCKATSCNWKGARVPRRFVWEDEELAGPTQKPCPRCGGKVERTFGQPIMRRRS